MRLTPHRALPAALLLAACAASPPQAPSGLPAALTAPAWQSLQLEALATGVQIYECRQKPDAGYEWAFKAPEASLSFPSGKALGRHYAGPTWEAADGSKVVGELRAKDPGPDASAIPWLLLAAKENSGSGIFAETKSIQRVATRGGLAPADACGAARLGDVARVPYSARYYFYR